MHSIPPLAEQRLTDDLDPRVVALRREQAEAEARAAALLERRLWEKSVKSGRQQLVRCGRN